MAKFFVDEYIPFFMPDAAPLSYAVGIGEFQDALKVIPIVLIQGVIQSMFFKQKFSHRLMKNTIDTVLAIVSINIIQRNIAKPIQSGVAAGGMTSGRRAVYRY